MTEPCDLPAVEARRLIGARQLSPVELDRGTPVKALQQGALLEAGVVEVAFECLLLPALDLVG